eukprot:691916-Amphidinium_carterae.1
MDGSIGLHGEFMGLHGEFLDHFPACAASSLIADPMHNLGERLVDREWLDAEISRLVGQPAASSYFSPSSIPDAATDNIRWYDTRCDLAYVLRHNFGWLVTQCQHGA